MRLDERTYVVAGGAGVAGECVVAALLRRGATVAVPSRSAQRLTALRAAYPGAGLHTYVGAMDTSDGVARVRDAIVDDLGAIDGVVASLGSWWEGPGLVELAEPIWRRLLDANLNSHFLAANGFLPAIVDRPESTYVTLNGIAADLAVAGSGPICVTGAAQRMMLRVLAEELATRPVRLHEVSILTPIVTRHWDGPPPKPDWLSGEEVGEYLADVVSPGFSDSGRLLLAIPSATST